MQWRRRGRRELREEGKIVRSNTGRKNGTMIIVPRWHHIGLACRWIPGNEQGTWTRRVQVLYTSFRELVFLSLHIVSSRRNMHLLTLELN